MEQGFSHIRVRGEISGFKRAASGHVYFALKDADAVLDAVMWKGQAVRIPFRAEDGLDVIATGRITTYPGRSKYQIVVESLELAGEGALLALLEKTKARLGAEGLFDRDRKQDLPYLPRVIGVVTSPTGAVIRDILHRLEDRMPTHVLVWPVLVQGQGAAEQVASAIRGFDALDPDGPIPRPDLVIVARGGGSIEDLWAFNEEVVVRAAADCRIPLISAVGHETDTTLIDFASDQRAPTPTAAAEMAVPVRADLEAELAERGARGLRAFSRLYAERRDRLADVSARLPTLDRLLAPQRQRLDDLTARMPQAYRLALSAKQRQLLQVSGGLRPALVEQRLRTARDRLEGHWRLLGSLDPRNLLRRGYAIVEAAGPDNEGQIVTSADSARVAQHLRLRFADGAVPVTVDGAGDVPPPATPTPRAPAAIRGKRDRDPPAGQPGLFD